MRRRLFPIATVCSALVLAGTLALVVAVIVGEDLFKSWEDPVDHGGVRVLVRRWGVFFQRRTIVYPRTVVVGPRIGTARDERSFLFAGLILRRFTDDVLDPKTWTPVGTDANTIVVSVPFLWPLLLSAPLPLVWLVRHHRRRLRRLAHPDRCPACGYDCRASPDRCPECGAPRRAPAAATAKAE